MVQGHAEAEPLLLRCLVGGQVWAIIGPLNPPPSTARTVAGREPRLLGAARGMFVLKRGAFSDRVLWRRGDGSPCRRGRPTTALPHDEFATAGRTRQLAAVRPRDAPLVELAAGRPTLDERDIRKCRSKTRGPSGSLGWPWRGPSFGASKGHDGGDEEAEEGDLVQHATRLPGRSVVDAVSPDPPQTQADVKEDQRQEEAPAAGKGSACDSGNDHGRVREDHRYDEAVEDGVQFGVVPPAAVTLTDNEPQGSADSEPCIPGEQSSGHVTSHAAGVHGSPGDVVAGPATQVPGPRSYQLLAKMLTGLIAELPDQRIAWGRHLVDRAQPSRAGNRRTARRPDPRNRDLDRRVRHHRPRQPMRRGLPDSGTADHPVPDDRPDYGRVGTASLAIALATGAALMRT